MSIHARTGILPLPDNQQRILHETHGFQALAREVEGLSGPVFADQRVRFARRGRKRSTKRGRAAARRNA